MENNNEKYMSAHTFVNLTPEQKKEILKEDIKLQVLSRNLDALRNIERLIENGLIMESADNKKAVHKFVRESCTAIIKAFE